MMLQIVIPMAGRGSRFQAAGYVMPKPLIDVKGQPMIQRVIDNIGLSGNYFFLALQEHCQQFDLSSQLQQFCGENPAQVIPVEGVTEGAACTVLLAKDYLDLQQPLLLANSDQLLDWNPAAFMEFMELTQADGGIITFIDDNPKWSFAKIDAWTGQVKEVAEKRPISNLATCGIYYFRKAEYFVSAAEEQCRRNTRVNGEFYVCPVFNILIEWDKQIYHYPIKQMMGLGTPEDLQIYLDSSR